MKAFRCYCQHPRQERTPRSLPARATFRGHQTGKAHAFGKPGRHLERVGQHVNHLLGEIDHRRAKDANLGQDIGEIEHRTGDRRAKIHLPKWNHRTWCVGIDRIHTVVNGDRVHNIADAFTRNLDTGGIQDLRIDLSIHGKRPDIAEAVGFYVYGFEMVSLKFELVLELS